MRHLDIFANGGTNADVEPTEVALQSGVLIMPEAAPEKVSDSRRDFVQKCGKFAVLTPPTVTMLLSTSMNSSAVAASGGGGGGPFGNNGVGNGYDPQPPGNPPVNDGVGTGPGNPGNRGGPNK